MAQLHFLPAGLARHWVTYAQSTQSINERIQLGAFLATLSYEAAKRGYTYQIGTGRPRRFRLAVGFALPNGSGVSSTIQLALDTLREQSDRYGWPLGDLVTPIVASASGYADFLSEWDRADYTGLIEVRSLAKFMEESGYATFAGLQAEGPFRKRVRNSLKTIERPTYSWIFQTSRAEIEHCFDGVHLAHFANEVIWIAPKHLGVLGSSMTPVPHQVYDQLRQELDQKLAVQEQRTGSKTIYLDNDFHAKAQGLQALVRRPPGRYTSLIRDYARRHLASVAALYAWQRGAHQVTSEDIDCADVFLCESVKEFEEVSEFAGYEKSLATEKRVRACIEHAGKKGITLAEIADIVERGRTRISQIVTEAERDREVIRDDRVTPHRVYMARYYPEA